MISCPLKFVHSPRVLLALVAVSALAMTGLSGATAITNREDRPNVLFLSLDDFGPYLKGYGHEQIIAPNMDGLMDRGFAFDRAYCQIAICAPSRSSLMTGMRPDSVAVYDLATHFREKVPNVVTLPQHFKNNGYYAQAVGKNFHPAFTFHSDVDGQPSLADPVSWDVPTWLPGPPRYYHTPEGIADVKKVFARTRMRKDETPDDWYKYVLRGFAVEAPDVPESALYDGQVTDKALQVLREIADRQRAAPAGEAQPFFMGVGFLKPHYPFIAPKKYWELYDRSEIKLAENNFPPRDAPPISLQVHWAEARAQSDVPNTGAILPAQQREMKHGYFACISYVDALIGRLLAELERQNLTDNTIIMLWGDHGFSLGENSIWAKLTNSEMSTRVPLLVVDPRKPELRGRSAGLVELIDMYPTLCDLAGLPKPEHLEGSSFVPLMEEPERPWKTAAFSQYHRYPIKNYRRHPLAIDTPMGYWDYPPEGAMGYSMRTDRYRFTLWHVTDQPDNVLGLELYDHQVDPAENVNIAGHPDQAELVAQLTQKLKAGWAAAQPQP